MFLMMTEDIFLNPTARNDMMNLGIPDDFVQDNISKSKKGTVRGLHYQVGENAQGKLCQVIEGEVLDVAVDIRFNSPTYGKYFSLILNSETKFQLWIPAGFAHGFSVLSDEAIFLVQMHKLLQQSSMKEQFFIMILYLKY